MKKLTYLLTATLSLCLPAFTSLTSLPLAIQSWGDDNHDLNIINISHLSHEDLNTIIQGDHPEIVVEFSAGTRLPIHFFLKGDLIHLIHNEENLDQIEIQQTLYAYYKQNELFLSTDCNEWKTFLEFITGNFSVSLSIENDQPHFTCGTEANQRN